MKQPSSDEIESLTERVIGCAIEVHRALGPGLLESVYRECMLIETRLQGLRLSANDVSPSSTEGNVFPQVLCWTWSSNASWSWS
jgi:GxxExxY protein